MTQNIDLDNKVETFVFNFSLWDRIKMCVAIMLNGKLVFKHANIELSVNGERM